MQWLIIARDGRNTAAPKRRLAASKAYIENAVTLQAKVRLLIDDALTNEGGDRR